MEILKAWGNLLKKKFLALSMRGSSTCMQTMSSAERKQFVREQQQILQRKAQSSRIGFEHLPIIHSNSTK